MAASVSEGTSLAFKYKEKFENLFEIVDRSVNQYFLLGLDSARRERITCLPVISLAIALALKALYVR